ncbi:MAG: hypothetical protein KBB11_08525 [Bacteroidales bacterium]|nr:hypothetical protein [Bacteroidales bacterium]HOY39225.1 hypothetical protein [Bacteroidales bacterium]HQP04975.1 hypothetical protein [Bacteroidales bacterium]
MKLTYFTIIGILHTKIPKIIITLAIMYVYLSHNPTRGYHPIDYCGIIASEKLTLMYQASDFIVLTSNKGKPG